MRRLCAVMLLIFSVTLLARAQSETDRSGTLDDSTPFVEFPVSFNQMTGLTVEMRATDGTLDPLVAVVDARTGNVLMQNDDRAAGDSTALIDDLILAEGDYIIVATRYGVLQGETSGDFVLTTRLRTAAPQSVSFDTTPAALAQVGFPTMPAQPRTEYTVIAYLGGDTNIEDYILNDLDEYERADSSARVRTIALIDRSPEYSSADGNWETTRLYTVSADTSADAVTTFPPTIDSTVLADLGTTDSGNGALLAQFLVWAVQTYPAEHYVISMSGHGGGWRGLIVDDSATTVIPLAELREAFRLGTEAAGVAKFDLLVNEACLMASVEYFGAVEAYFHQTIASPEVVVAPSLDGQLLLEGLADAQTGDTAVGTALVNAYVAAVGATNTVSADYLSFAVTDLDKFAPVMTAVEAFAQVVNSDPLRYSTLIGLAYTNSYKIGTFASINDKIDLGHFMQQIIGLTGDTPIVTAANDVVQALAAARVYGNATDIARLYTSYYNIYFPASAEGLTGRYFEESPFIYWDQMLLNYFATINPRPWSLENEITAIHPPLAPQVIIRSITDTLITPALPPTLALQIVGKGIAQGEFIVDRTLPDGRTVRVLSVAVLTELQLPDRTAFINNWKSGVDLSTFTWTPFKLPGVTDGSHTNNELVIRNREQATLAGEYRVSSTDDWQTVTAIFDDNDTASTAYTVNAHGTVASTFIPADAEFRAFQYEVQSDGTTRQVAGNTYTWGSLRLTSTIPPSGAYTLGFLVTALSGASGFASVPVTIDSAAATEASQTYVDTANGLAFQMPAAVQQTFSDGMMLLSADDFTAAVFSAPVSEESPYAALNAFVTAQQISSYTGDALMQIADQNTLLLTLADGRRGIAFVRTTRDGLQGIVITAQNDAQLQQIADSLRTFEQPNFDSGSIGDWTYATLERGLSYPVPLGWQASQDTDGFTRYTAPDGQSFVRVGAADANFNVDNVFFARRGDDNTEPSYIHTPFSEWQILPSRRTIDGQARVGRLYYTFPVRHQTERVYLVEFETNADEGAAQIFRTVFEPLVEGFAPPLTTTLTTNDIRPSQIKALILQTDDRCRTSEIATNVYCVAKGSVLVNATDVVVPNFAKPRLATPLAAIAGEQSLVGVTQISVGTNLDGTQTPDSAALVRLADADIIALGGVTLTDANPLQPGQNVFIEGTYLEARVNVRQTPAPNAAIVSVIERTTAFRYIARLSDNTWMRVQLENGIIGWVLASLLPDDPRRASLPINLFDAPYFAPMTNLDITLSSDVTASLPNEILIRANRAVTLRLNGVDVTLAGGTVLLWRATDTDGEVVDFNSEGVVGLIARRRPVSWTSDILRGAVRVVNPLHPDQVVIGIAGTGIRAALDTAPTLEAIAPDARDLAQIVSNSVTGQITPPLTDEEVADFQALQDTLQDVALDTLADLPYYYAEEEAPAPLEYLQEEDPALSLTEDAPSDEDVLPTDAPAEDAPADDTPDAAEDDTSRLPNWCDPGGIWGDGRCNDTDPDVRAYLYRLGYTGMAYEAGILSADQIPSEFLNAIIPPANTDVPTLTAVLRLNVAATYVCSGTPTIITFTVSGAVGTLDFTTEVVSGVGATISGVEPATNGYEIFINCATNGTATYSISVIDATTDAYTSATFTAAP